MMSEEAIEAGGKDEFVVSTMIMCRILELTQIRDKPSDEFARKVESGECAKTSGDFAVHDEL
jgi:hypothetical protein